MSDTKMISAKEARDIATSTSNMELIVKLQMADEAIKRAAKKGKTVATVNVTFAYDQSNLRAVFEGKLKELGYTVKHEKHSDMRESWDYYVVGW